MNRRYWSLFMVTLGIVVGMAISRADKTWGERGDAMSLHLPDLDFSAMAIATRRVHASAHGSDSPVRVNAWERCALGTANCDMQHRTVEARCLGNGQTVLIHEADWPAFVRITEEDLRGVHGLPSDMRLCPSRPR